MKTAKLIKTQKAMTLVELMVSVLLVTLMAGTVLALLVQNMKMGGTIDYNYAAVNIAKSRIDRIRGLRRDQGFSNLPAIESNTRVDRNGLPDENGDFTRTTVITANFGGNANLTKIEVTVNYNTAGGVNTTTIVLTSLLSPYI